MSVAKKTKRNSWHEGSVRQRSDGRFEGRVTLNGLTKYTYGKTETECKRKLKNIIREYDDGLINPKTASLYNYCKLYVNQKKNCIEPSTLNRLNIIVERQIGESKICNKQIGALKSEELQELFLSLSSQYSYGTIKNIYNFVSGVYNHAIANKDISYNPMLTTSIPKEKLCKKTKETFALSPNQIVEFKSSCLEKNKSNGLYKYRYGLTLLLILNTGMRIGEAIALEWNDIDFDKKLIRINKSMQYNIKVENSNRRESFVKSPKTRNSKRIIPINNEIEYVLGEIKKMNSGIKTDIVCCNENGGYALARSIQRALTMVTKNTNIPYIWVHLLRHTFGSELIRKGVDISIVSRLMGHSNTTTTYNSYIHVLEEEAAKAMSLPMIS